MPRDNLLRSRICKCLHFKDRLIIFPTKLYNGRSQNTFACYSSVSDCIIRREKNGLHFLPMYLAVSASVFLKQCIIWAPKRYCSLIYSTVFSCIWDTDNTLSIQDALVHYTLTVEVWLIVAR